MKRVLKALGVILAVFTIVGCSIDDGDVNFEFVNLKITEVEVPESFNLNEVYPIKITYLRPDDCTYFYGYDVIKADQTIRNIVVVGSVMTDEVCEQQMEQIETSFNFEVIYSEDYLFRFWTGNDENGNPEYLEIEVPVN